MGLESLSKNIIYSAYMNVLAEYITDKGINILSKMWYDPHRFYHNINHLLSIIKAIEKNVWFKELQVKEKHILLIAAFFHDAIYEVKRKDNEDQSIKLFKLCLKPNTPKELVDSVIRLIETTKHRKRPIDKLERIFWDADNAGFIGSYYNFEKIDNLLKKEYSFLSKEQWTKGRIEFLESNLGLFGSVGDNNINKLLKKYKKDLK